MNHERADVHALHQATQLSDVFEESMFYRRSTIGGSLNRLLAVGWVVPDGIDGRYRLTEKGRAELEALAPRPKGPKKMRRHNAAERALRELTSGGDLFDGAIFLKAGTVGPGSLGRFIAEGWVVPDAQFGGSYRITGKGRAGLEALEAEPKAKNRK